MTVETAIQAKLKSGQCARAATELVEYFEANHVGDKIFTRLAYYTHSQS